MSDTTTPAREAHAMSATDGLVWIALNVSMASVAGSDVDDYVSVPRAEWESMTEDEREARIQEEVDELLANSVNAGGAVVDEADVPSEYRHPATARAARIES